MRAMAKPEIQDRLGVEGTEETENTRVSVSLQTTQQKLCLIYVTSQLCTKAASFIELNDAQK